MRKFIIASHHKMAEGIQDTVNFVTGAKDNVYALSAYLANTPIQSEVETLFEEIMDDDEVVIFTDILGGSVNQAFSKYIARPHVHLIAGMNLPIIIALISEPDKGYLTPDQIRDTLNEARNQLTYVNDFVADVSEDDE